MTFKLQYNDTKSNARAGSITTDHGVIETPIFMPMSAQDTVKGVCMTELKEDTKVQVVLGNIYHLYLRPDIQILEQAGGLRKSNIWGRPILTDSGGFQVFFLSDNRKLHKEGAEFRSRLDGFRHTFMPEKAMNIERSIGTDIIMAFDECYPRDVDHSYVRQSLGLTECWPDRCFARLSNTEPKCGYRRSLSPIVQGCVYTDLRQRVAENMARKGADGNTIGGLIADKPTGRVYGIIEVVNSILPKDKPRYLIGAGIPINLLEGIEQGTDIFDCTVPTRNGRSGQLSTRFDTINMHDKKWENDFSPVDPDGCSYVDILYSKAYLHHLIKAKEMLGLQTASTHNLTSYLWLVKGARVYIIAGDFTMRESGMIR